MEGLLIYKREDYLKNTSYANMLIEYGSLEGLEIRCICFEDIRFGVDEKGLWLSIDKQPIEPIDFVINRTRETMLAKQFEQMGIRVFNSSEVTHIANHKGRTHQFVSALGLPAVKTMLYYPKFMSVQNLDFGYPLVIKSPDGHGGSEVFKADNEQELEEIIRSNQREEWIIQALCNHVGEDVRVFVIGNKIIGAIRRYSKVDFRANYCLGGQIESYTLNKDEENLVYQLLNHLKCDYVGVDFMIDKDGKFIFNELEDAVGSRSLYTLNKVDTAKLYINYISKEMKLIKM